MSALINGKRQNDLLLIRHASDSSSPANECRHSFPYFFFFFINLFVHLLYPSLYAYKISVVIGMCLRSSKSVVYFTLHSF